MAHPPAGWHPDPLNRHAQRYWDGNQWTEHVADQSGNMSTDPLDGGQAPQQSQQDTGGWGQSSQSDQSWGQSGGETGGQSGGRAESSWSEPSSDQGSWGSDTGTAAWGSTDTAGAGTTSDDTASRDEWQPSTAGREAGSDEDSGWGTDAGVAAGTAAGAAAASDDRSAPVDDEPGDGDTIAHVDDSEALGASHVDVAHPAIAVVTVGSGVVVRHGHVVAASPGLSMHDSVHPGATEVSGAGTVHVGADGRHITVVDVPASGLTVADHALVAHSTGLERAAASDGIVGLDATTVTGGGWVAIAAVGGTVEVSPTGGVDVPTPALVAWSSDLDVAHGETVTLTGRGTVLVSAVTA